MIPKIILPEIPEEEMTPTVKALLDVISQLTEIVNEQAIQIQDLKDEIARLKGGNPKPKIRPSKMDDDLNKSKRGGNSKKSSSRKKKRKKRIHINKTEELHPDDLPEGSKFIKYKDYYVQDILFQSYNILYRRGYWRLPSGEYRTAELPEDVKFGGHYGTALKQYVLHLNYELNVPQSKIHESLLAFGVDISTGEVNNILIDKKDIFHTEKNLILETGLKFSPYIVTDDTGARHAGANGFCTHIGSEYFAWFKSTETKSRINFLELLRGTHTDYMIDSTALSYMEDHGLGMKKRERFTRSIGRVFQDKETWDSHLKMIGIRNKKHIRIATEGALLASVISHGINKDIVIVSDDAGQFDVLLHALCWIHAERKINDLLPINDYQREVIDKIRDDIWKLYADLKEYKASPNAVMKKNELESQFEDIFTQETDFDTINKVLKLLYDNKKGLLMVLERPEIPLNNNFSENDIRCYVNKRKIHGGTRSEKGRLCRDTFLSLKKTCKKLNISFNDYLFDRLSGKYSIPLLSEIIAFKYAEVGG